MTHLYQTHTHISKPSNILTGLIILSTASVLKHDTSQKPGFHTRYQKLFVTQDTTDLGDYKNGTSRQGPVDVRTHTHFNNHPSRTFKTLALHLIVILR